MGAGRLLQDSYAQSRVVGEAQLAEDQAPALQGGDLGWAPHLCSTWQHRSGVELRCSALGTLGTGITEPGQHT